MCQAVNLQLSIENLILHSVATDTMCSVKETGNWISPAPLQVNENLIEPITPVFSNWCEDAHHHVLIKNDVFFNHLFHSKGVNKSTTIIPNNFDQYTTIDLLPNILEYLFVSTAVLGPLWPQTRSKKGGVTKNRPTGGQTNGGSAVTAQNPSQNFSSNATVNYNGWVQSNSISSGGAGGSGDDPNRPRSNGDGPNHYAPFISLELEMSAERMFEWVKKIQEINGFSYKIQNGVIYSKTSKRKHTVIGFQSPFAPPLIYEKPEGENSPYNLVTNSKKYQRLGEFLTGRRLHVGSEFTETINSVSNVSLNDITNKIFNSNELQQANTSGISNRNNYTHNGSNISNRNNYTHNGSNIPFPIILGLEFLLAAVIGNSSFGETVSNVVQPRRRRLKNAGFVRGRQNFRDSVAFAQPFTNGRKILPLPGTNEYRKNRLVTPSCNLQDENSDLFQSAQTDGQEFERRLYIRRFPEYRGVVCSEGGTELTDPQSLFGTVLATLGAALLTRLIRRLFPGKKKKK